MNQALLFNRPGESDYNRFRRLIVANCGLNKLDEKLALPKYLGLDKQCPDCAKSLFHSDVNELFWLHVCPIHLADLTKTCPACGDQWPSVDRLTKAKCAMCGGKMTSDELSNISGKLEWPFERIKKIKSVFANNELGRLQSHKFSVVDRFNESMPRKEIVESDFYPSYVAAQLELSESRVREFESYGIRFLKLNQLHFKWEECPVSDEEFHTVDEYEIQGDIRKRVYIRATKSLNEVLPDGHSPLHLSGNSYCEIKDCPFCKTHKLFKASVTHENVDYFSRSQAIHLEAIGPNFLLPHLAVNLLHFNHYRLPSRVSRLIYYLDFWAFFISAFYFFASEKNRTCPSRFTPPFIFDSPTGKYMCPIQIVENYDDGLVLYYPDFLAKMELPVAGDFFNLPSVKKRY